MAQNTKPAAQKPEAPAVPKNSKNTLIMIAGGILLVIIAAGVGWYFAKGKNGAAHVEEVKVAAPKTPIFVVLDPFTVNLQRESSDQYLQMGISLKLYETDIEAKIKASLPEIRSRILQLLTTKTASELLTAEGKKQLIREILSLGNSSIGIVDTPAPAALAEKPVKVDTASHVADPGIDTHQPNAAETAPSQYTAAKPPGEQKGIVDVLFTSFIIQ
jgi:flagellar protein FliL